MRIVIAMDSFKGSLSSIEAGNAVKQALCLDFENVASQGFRRFKEHDIQIFPFADGGEGTMDTLLFAKNGKKESLLATGPLGEMLSTEYGMIPEEKLAIIEMAKVSGLTLVPESHRNPMHTTTYGMGELIRDAIEKGYRNFIIGIGGSATNDGGVGMLQALGYDFRDKIGTPISFGALGLKQLHSIDTAHAMPQLSECNFQIACDVTNPLCGSTGCSFIFAPQKGANKEELPLMDSWMKHYGDLAKSINSNGNPFSPGAGAAGGIGFAFQTFLDGSLKSGSEIVCETLAIEDAIKNCDLVITGEGRIDGQSSMGKGPLYIAGIAKKYQKKVLLFAGSVGEGAEICLEQGVSAYYGITPDTCSLEEAMKPAIAMKNLRDKVREVVIIGQHSQDFIEEIYKKQGNLPH